MWHRTEEDLRENLEAEFEEKLIPKFEKLSQYLGEKPYLMHYITIADFELLWIKEILDIIVFRTGIPCPFSRFHFLTRLVRELRMRPGLKEYFAGETYETKVFLPEHVSWMFVPIPEPEEPEVPDVPVVEGGEQTTDFVGEGEKKAEGEGVVVSKEKEEVSVPATPEGEVKKEDAPVAPIEEVKKEDASVAPVEEKKKDATVVAPVEEKNKEDSITAPGVKIDEAKVEVSEIKEVVVVET